MKEKEMTQSELVTASGLSKTTISRIVRNRNDKGSSYQPTPPVIMAIAIGLKLTSQEYEELTYAAYPELSYMKEFLDKRFTIHDANIILEENGFPLLGNIAGE